MRWQETLVVTLVVTVVAALASVASADVTETWDGAEWSNGQVVDGNNGWVLATGLGANGENVVNAMGHAGTRGFGKSQKAAAKAIFQKSLGETISSGICVAKAFINVQSTSRANAGIGVYLDADNYMRVEVYNDLNTTLKIKSNGVYGEREVEDGGLGTLGWFELQIIYDLNFDSGHARYRNVDNDAAQYIGDWVNLASFPVTPTFNVTDILIQAGNASNNGDNNSGFVDNIGIGVPKQPSPEPRKPLPESAIEIADIPTIGGFVKRRDGSLMLITGAEYRLSTDGGRTWGKAQTLNSASEIYGIVRLRSGDLGGWGKLREVHGGGFVYMTSADEGRSWSQPMIITEDKRLYAYHNSLIEMKSGRLLFAVYWQGYNGYGLHPETRFVGSVASWGTWKGFRLGIEGHGHAPEMGISMVYRSDDGGKTWEKHPGGMQGWFDQTGRVNGRQGLTPVFEPTIAELPGGGVRLIARSTVGRLVTTLSLDEGETWQMVRPTSLPSSQSPGALTRLPTPNHLLLVWNQHPPEEILKGYRRNRLSAAISKDGGHSWENFKTLELSAGIPDIDRLQPAYPVGPVRCEKWVGYLPDGYVQAAYPHVDVIGDNVFVRYYRRWPVEPYTGDTATMPVLFLMRIYPLRWFYE